MLDAWLTWSWRLWRPAFPPGVRWFPQALAADARTSSVDRSGRSLFGPSLAGWDD
jgi:hypothetical protein